MTPEGRVKKEVRKVLDELGIFYYMPVGGMYGRSGVSDFICCVNGQFVSIETKAGTNAPTKLQSKFISDVHAAGGCAFVIWDAQYEWLKNRLREMS